MKRHPALESLSRDHHHALVVAQRLKRPTDSTAADARAAFLQYWQADGREHFREEEEVLLPARRSALIAGGVRHGPPPPSGPSSVTATGA